MLCCCVQGPECCSDSAVTFHYMTGFNMYMMEYLVYHLKPFGVLSHLSELQPYLSQPPTVLAQYRPSSAGVDKLHAPSDQKEKERDKPTKLAR